MSKKTTSKHCRIVAVVTRADYTTAIKVRFPGGGLYIYDKSNASEYQLEELKRWDDSKPMSLLKWLHTQGIQNKALRIPTPEEARAKALAMGGE